MSERDNSPKKPATLDARRRAMEEAVQRARANQAPAPRDAYTAAEDAEALDLDNGRTVKMTRLPDALQAFEERAVHTQKLKRIAPSPAPEEVPRRGNNLLMALALVVLAALAALSVRYLL